MSSKGASRLNLSQCKAIEENQFRSSNNQKDYQPEEVIARIWEIQARKDSKALKELEKRALLRERAEKRMPVIRLMESLGLVDEGQLASEDWKDETEYMVLENGFSRVAIPPVIINF